MTGNAARTASTARGGSGAAVVRPQAGEQRQEPERKESLVAVEELYAHIMVLITIKTVA